MGTAKKRMNWEDWNRKEKNELGRRKRQKLSFYKHVELYSDLFHT